MRPSKDVWFTDMAVLISRRSTCHRLPVGCVLVNERGHVLSTGYNGVAAGLPHCNDEVIAKNGSFFPHKCPNSDTPLGQPNGCESIHGEQNALLQCPDVFKIHTCYVTHSPCVTCVKLLMNTSCERVVYLNEYPHANAKQLWLSSRRPSAPANLGFLDAAREWLRLVG